MIAGVSSSLSLPGRTDVLANWRKLPLETADGEGLCLVTEVDDCSSFA